MWPPGNELMTPNAYHAGYEISENLHELRRKMKKQCARDEKCLERCRGIRRKRNLGKLPNIRNRRAFGKGIRCYVWPSKPKYKSHIMSAERTPCPVRRAVAWLGCGRDNPSLVQLQCLVCRGGGSLGDYICDDRGVRSPCPVLCRPWSAWLAAGRMATAWNLAAARPGIRTGRRHYSFGDRANMDGYRTARRNCRDQDFPESFPRNGHRHVTSRG